MASVERVIAELQGSERQFNLDLHYGHISIFLGRAAFSLIHSGELQDIGERSLFLNERLAGYKRNVSTKSAALAPGQLVRIGRTSGVEIFNADGSIDEQEMANFRDEALFRSLNQDINLSRQHAEISVVDSVAVIIKDLRSTNGTIIKDITYQSPSGGPPNLHRVK